MRAAKLLVPGRVSVLFFSEFLLLFVCYLLALAGYFRAGTLNYLLDDHGLVRIVLTVISIQLGLFFGELYSHLRVTFKFGLLLKLLNVFGVAFIVQGLLSYMAVGFRLPRTIMITGSALALPGVFAWRIFYSSVIWKWFGTQRVLFAGTDPIVEQIARWMIEHPAYGYEIVGYLDEETAADKPLTGGLLLGPVADIEEIVERFRPALVVVGMSDWRNALPIASLLRLSRRGVVLQDAVATYERACNRVSSRDFRPSQIIFENQLRSRPGSVALQSIYTNLLALAGILLCAPLMLAIAIAVKLSSPGPVLATQERMGFNSIPFQLNRFRCTNLPAQGEMPRRTPLGSWLERLHLDRLPTLFNLLRGEMALVGPRPEHPDFVQVLSRHIPFYGQRHTVKPGITGWSQIKLSRGEGPGDALLALEYDLYYTKHISLTLDAYIILHSIRALLPVWEK